MTTCKRWVVSLTNQQKLLTHSPRQTAQIDSALQPQVEVGGKYNDKNKLITYDASRYANSLHAYLTSDVMEPCVGKHISKSSFLLLDQEGRKEGNVLFNDALNTFYLLLYGVTHMVKDHSDSEKGNPLPPHRLLLSINSKGSFICTIPQTG